jgi:hypothetical protein
MIQKLVNDRTCYGCIYYKKLKGSNTYSVMACYYCHDTGRARGSFVGECTKKIQKPDGSGGK